MESDDPNLIRVAQVTVIFNPAGDGKRVTFDPDDEIEFKTARGTVTFKLDVKTALEVRFPSNPIQWVQEIGNDLVPIDPPGEATVSRSDDSTRVTITAPAGDATFRFYVIVQSIEGKDGRFFGSDPTIVTMRPPG